MSSSLEETQRQIFALITAPGGVARAVEELRAGNPATGPLNALIRGATPEIAADRLQRYADMYYYRLLDILRNDYRGLLALVGDKTFAQLTRDYLVAHPSTSPSVRDVGVHMAEFLRAYAPIIEPFPFAADLATLERARDEVFDRAAATPLTSEDLAAIAPEQWAELTFRPVPAARLIDLEWPVTELWRPLIWDEGEVPEMAPAPTCVLVWRREFKVWHRLVSAEEQPRIRQLFAGASFAQICESFAGAEDDIEAAAQRAAQALAGWVGEELLVLA